MQDNGNLPSMDAAKIGVDVYSRMTLFYHDMEAKVGSTISAINAGILLFSDKAALPEMLRLKVAGGIIVALSFVGIISVLTYWRYYEACWLYATEYKTALETREVQKSIHSVVDRRMSERYPLLKRLPFNSHHYFWLMLMVMWCVTGIIFLMPR